MSTSARYVGVDGGGTKTAYMLVGPGGEIVASHTGPGCNPSSVGEEEAAERVRSGIGQLLAGEGVDPTSIERLLLCMAGSRIFWRNLLKESNPLPSASAAAVGDHYPVLELGTGGQPGLVLHAGTGSFIVAREPGGKVRVGGAIGYLLGDPASGFELGRLALQKVSLQIQGLGEKGALHQLVTERFEFNDLESMVRQVYHRPTFVADAAALAPELLALVESGEDSSAREVMEDAVLPFLRWASQMVKSCGLFPPGNPDGHKAAISGAILHHPGVHGFAREQWERLGHAWIFESIQGTPSEGVAALVARGDLTP